MRRSEINAIMREADAFIRAQGFHLPPFAYWQPEAWRLRGDEISEIVENGLGWDITDFGSGSYQETGLFLFTVRNGKLENLKRGTGKVYAEKIMMVGVQQVTPLHFHWQKVEDIINRGGGQLVIQLYNATAEEGLADSDITVPDPQDEEIAAWPYQALQPHQRELIDGWRAAWAAAGRL